MGMIDRHLEAVGPLDFQVFEMSLLPPSHWWRHGAAEESAIDYDNARLVRRLSVYPLQRTKELSTNQVGRSRYTRSRAICFRAFGKFPKVDHLLLSSTGLDLGKNHGQWPPASLRYVASLRMDGSTASLYRLAH